VGVHSITIMNKIDKGVDSQPYSLAGASLGMFAALCVIFPNLAVAGLGLGIVPFVLLAVVVYATVAVSSRPLFELDGRIVTAIGLYLLFCMAMLAGFIANEDVGAKAIYYLASLASNIIWVLILVMLFQRQPAFFMSFMGFFAGVVILFVAIQWLYLLLQLKDVFFLRTETTALAQGLYGVIANPNTVARLLITLLPLLYFYNMRSKLLGRFGYMPGLGMVIVSVLVISTLSRANLVALGLFFLFAWVLRREPSKESRSIWIAILLIGTPLALLALPVLIERMDKTIYMFERTYRIVVDGEGGLIPIRFRTWLATMGIISDHPLFGVGISRISDFQFEYGAVKYGANGAQKAIAVHSGFLKIAAYGGMVSLACLLIFFVRIWTATKKIVADDEARKSHQGCAAISLLLLLIVMVPMNIGADSFGQPYTWIVLASLMALAFSPDRHCPMNSNGNANIGQGQ